MSSSGEPHGFWPQPFPLSFSHSRLVWDELNLPVEPERWPETCLPKAREATS